MNNSQIFQPERQKVNLRFAPMHWEKEKTKSKYLDSFLLSPTFLSQIEINFLNFKWFLTDHSFPSNKYLEIADF